MLQQKLLPRRFVAVVQQKLIAGNLALQGLAKSGHGDVLVALGKDPDLIGHLLAAFSSVCLGVSRRLLFAHGRAPLGQKPLGQESIQLAVRDGADVRAVEFDFPLMA